MLPIHNNQKFAQLYEQNRDLIFSLKCTPESWLIEHLENQDANLTSCIRYNYHCEINTILTDSRIHPQPFKNYYHST